METQILQAITDSNGNISYFQIDTQVFVGTADALAYLQSLPAGMYMAQTITAVGTSVLAMVP